MGKNILFVLGAEDFRDAEYFVPAEILKKAGHQIFVASDTVAGETAFGADGGEVKVDSNIKEIKPEDFDMFVFVGGPGALKHLDNKSNYELIRGIVGAGKHLAAICIAPVILAKAGVLKGKKATVWSSTLDKSPVKILKEQGAFYEEKPVVSDGKIITSDGPSSAEEFGQTLREAIL